MINSVKIELLAKVENVMFARTILVGFLVELNPSLNFVNELKTVISEAVTNAIVHGYQEDSQQYVHLEIAYDDEFVYLEVSDEGVGIEDVDQAKEPLFSSQLNEERAGLGFTIMEIFTDEMKVESTKGIGTTLKFKKRYLSDEQANS